MDLSSIMEDPDLQIVNDLDVTCLNRHNSTFRASFNGTTNKSFLSTKDFSISSIISNFSQLLDGNTSSSFLMHVEEKAKTQDWMIDDMDEADRQEILRRVSEVCGRSVNSLPLSFANSVSGITTPFQIQGMGNGGDSWDEFDKVIEKCLPTKDWELVEFEDLAQQSILSEPAEQAEDRFMSAEEAKKEMDKEEELRAQFLQSDDAEFVALNNISSSLLDPLSMSNYFQARSSFPVDNCANDSTMLGFGEGDETRNRRPLLGSDPVNNRPRRPWDSIMFDKDKTLLGLDPTIVSHSNSVIEELLRASGKNKKEDCPSVVESTPKSAVSVHQYLLNSVSNGKTVDEITEYILQACRVSAEHQSKRTINAPTTVGKGNLPKSSATSGQAKGIPRPRPKTSTPHKVPNRKVEESNTTKTSSRLNKPIQPSTVKRNTKVSFQVPEKDQISSQPSSVSVAGNNNCRPHSELLVTVSTPAVANLTKSASGLPESLSKNFKSETGDSSKKVTSKKTSTSSTSNKPVQTVPVDHRTKVAFQVPEKEKVSFQPSYGKVSGNNNGLPRPELFGTSNTPVVVANVNLPTFTSCSSQTKGIPRPVPKISKPQTDTSNPKVEESIVTSRGLNKPLEPRPVPRNKEVTSQPFLGPVPTSNYCHPHSEQFGSAPQQPGYSLPLSIHIHLPAFHPGMMYPYGPYPPPNPSQPYEYSTQHQLHPSNLPMTYSHPSGQQ